VTELRLLYLSSWFPYPPDNGSRQRTFNLIRHLAQEFELTLVALSDAEQEPLQVEQLEVYCKSILTHPRPTFAPTRLRALAGFFSRRPRSLVDTFDRELQNQIVELLSRDAFDAILVGELSMASYARGLAQAGKILDAAEVSIFADAYRQRVGTAKWRHGLTWVKYARYLRELSKQFCALTVVSQREKEGFERIGVPTSKVRVIPNGVDCCESNSSFTTRDPFALIYNGAVTYSANLDAMRYFVKEILPRIVEQEPRAHVRITGRADQVAINELSVHNAVSFTGYVPDARPLVQSSAVCVVPLRTGGGTRLKILEALALGTPVVATSKGAEGLNVRDGEHLLIADDPRAFADAVIRLLQDQPLRGRLTQAARTRVCAEYDWSQIADQLGQVIQNCATLEHDKSRRGS
jgi:glycosyltransferase involved in cell wall biosynthesis